jgi:hypothetical protein
MGTGRAGGAARQMYPCPEKRPIRAAIQRRRRIRGVYADEGMLPSGARGNAGRPDPSVCARSQTLNGGSGQGGKVVQHPEPLQRHYRGGRQGYSD